MTHDSVQMVIRKTFYDEGYDNLRFRSGVSKVGRAFLHTLLLPIGAVVHVVNKRLLCCVGNNNSVGDEEEGLKLKTADGDDDDEDSNPTKDFSYRNVMRLFEVPANRLTSQIVCYLVFLVLLALSQINPEDTNGKVDVDAYDILVVMWTLGNIARDLGHMYARAEASAARSTWFSLTPWRKFFSKKLYTFRLVSHSILLFGFAIETFGYLCESKIPMRDPHNRDCDIDDPYSYGGYHMVKVGISLQGLGLTMIIVYGLHLFRLDSDMGAFYIALGRCLKIVASFFSTLAVVSAAFAMGMHAMLRFSGEECREGHAVLSDCGGGSQFYMERVEIGLACEVVLEEGDDSRRSNRTLCDDECWKAYVTDPTNEDYWSEACSSNGMQMVPKIEADLHYLG